MPTTSCRRPAVSNTITEALVESGAAADALAATAIFAAALNEAGSATDTYTIPGQNTGTQQLSQKARVPRLPLGFV